MTEDSNDAVPTPAGYTSVKMESTTHPVLPTATTLFRKTATGGETSATFTFAKVEGEATAVAVVYRGVDPANPTGPVDGPTFNATGNNSPTTLPLGSVSASYRGEMLVLAQGAANFSPAGSWTAPAGMTEEAVQSNQTLAAGAVADQTLTSAGATGSRTITFSIGTSLMGIMVALKPAQPVLYYHGDQLGSTRVMTDSIGAVRATFKFDSYGNLAGQSGTATTPLLFGGQYRDAETGFYYLRARDYDPLTAQFLSRDPMVATTRSPHAYVGDNPLNLADPSGLDAWWQDQPGYRGQYNPNAGMPCPKVGFLPPPPDGRIDPLAYLFTGGDPPQIPIGSTSPAGSIGQSNDPGTFQWLGDHIQQILSGVKNCATGAAAGARFGGVGIFIPGFGELEVVGAAGVGCGVNVGLGAAGAPAA